MYANEDLFRSLKMYANEDIYIYSEKLWPSTKYIMLLENNNCSPEYIKKLILEYLEQTNYLKTNNTYEHEFFNVYNLIKKLQRKNVFNSEEAEEIIKKLDRR